MKEKGGGYLEGFVWVLEWNSIINARVWMIMDNYWDFYLKYIRLWSMM